MKIILLVILALSGLPLIVAALSTLGNQIVNANGENVRIQGVNWFGFETGTRSPHGLWVHNFKWYLDKAKELGFNTLRIPWCNEMLRAGITVPANEGTNPYSLSLSLNPELRGLTPLQILDQIVIYCEAINLQIFLDRHSARPDNFFNEDIWYIPGDAYYTQQRWIDDWVMLANRYKTSPAVIGADLFNEPKNTAVWAQWKVAAELCGNAIHKANPNWLIIVEGVQSEQGYYWWGGNLKGVRANPVNLAVPNKLVYSLHDYPKTVYAQPWFDAVNYPANLDEVWREFWGYIFEDSIAPVLIGEFGTFLVEESDKLWLNKLTDYMDGDLNLDGKNLLSAGQKGMSFTYWSLNPDSGDTGGILQDDWTTINSNKLAYLTLFSAPSATPATTPTATPAATPMATPMATPTATPTGPTLSPIENPTAAPTACTKTQGGGSCSANGDCCSGVCVGKGRRATCAAPAPVPVPSPSPAASTTASPIANPNPTNPTANPTANPIANPTANPNSNPTAGPVSSGNECSGIAPWNNYTRYNSGDTVLFNSILYTAQRIVKGKNPSNASYWTNEGPCSSSGNLRKGY